MVYAACAYIQLSVIGDCTCGHPYNDIVYIFESAQNDAVRIGTYPMTMICIPGKICRICMDEAIKHRRNYISGHVDSDIVYIFEEFRKGMIS